MFNRLPLDPLEHNVEVKIVFSSNLFCKPLETDIRCIKLYLPLINRCKSTVTFFNKL